MSDEIRKKAAHALHEHRHGLSKGEPIPPPLVMASVYNLAGDPAGFRQYGRHDNASWEAAESLLGALEDATAVAFPSGMAAISAAFFALAKAGDRVLIPSDGYYTTRILADRYLTRLGITVETRPTSALMDGGIEGFRLVFVETPSNPGLDLTDLSALSQAARAAGAITVADNTAMTPFGQRPLDLGIDLVVAADTKAPNGHSDVLFGHVSGRDPAMMAEIVGWRGISGAIPGPFEAWLVHRGLETLELRFERMCDTAEALAPRLAAHGAVRAVRFPGLAGDPSHNLARQQMSRFGSLIGLTFKDEATAEAFIDGCALLQPSTSFGGLHSSAERRARWGDAVAPGFVRLSVGCEPTEALWDAIEASLDRLA